MNYKLIYDNFIDNRRSMNPNVFEIHHIVPRSQGGSNIKDNLIKLSPSDHLFAHSLLARIYNTSALWYALFRMTKLKKYISSKSLRHSHNEARTRFIESQRLSKTTSHRLAISNALKNKSKSESHREALSKANIGKRLSDEHKAKISMSSRGRVISDEHKAKLSRLFKGIPLSDATKQKLRESALGRRHSEDSKQLMSLQRSKEVIVFFNDFNSTKTFTSAKEAAKFFNVSASNVSLFCRKRVTVNSKRINNVSFRYSND